MKILRVLFGTLVVLAFAVGCDHKATKNAPSSGGERVIKLIDKQFKSATAEAKASSDAAIEAFKKSDFEKGAAALLTLRSMPTLTADQANAVHNAIRQLQMDLAEMAGNGATNVDQAIQMLRMAR